MPLPAPVPAAEPLTLEAGGSVVVLHAADGGRFTRLRLAGRDWLAAGALDDRVAVGADAPDAARAAVTTRTGAAAAVTRADDAGCGYGYERTVTVQPDGAVRVEHAVTSRADAPADLRWSAQLRLALVPSTRLDLPVAARVRVQGERGVALGGAGAHHRWPVLRVGGPDSTRFGPREVDFTFPALAPRRFGDAGPGAYACALALDLPRPAGLPVRLGVEQAGARLEVAVDPALVPRATLDLDAAAGGGGGTLALGLAFGPPLGTADDGSAPAVVLAPGATHRWAVTWRGRAAPASA